VINGTRQKLLRLTSTRPCYQENELIVERGKFEVNIEGEGEANLPRDETNAIVKAGHLTHHFSSQHEPCYQHRFATGTPPKPHVP